jgi:hypothetical protein
MGPDVPPRTPLRRLRARPTAATGLTHPSVQQTGDHPQRSAGFPGYLGMHHAVIQHCRDRQARRRSRDGGSGLSRRSDAAHFRSQGRRGRAARIDHERSNVADATDCKQRLAQSWTNLSPADVQSGRATPPLIQQIARSGCAAENFLRTHVAGDDVRPSRPQRFPVQAPHDPRFKSAAGPARLAGAETWELRSSPPADPTSYPYLG